MKKNYETYDSSFDTPFSNNANALYICHGNFQKLLVQNCTE